jgi:putative spermidine/putrescine transport system substrate-binding protein
VPHLTRRRSSRAAGAVLAACVFAGSGAAYESTASASSANTTLTVDCYPATPGTGWYTLWNKYIEPGFEKKYHATISYNQENSSDTIAKLEAQKSSPSTDLACLDTGPNVEAMNMGLLAPLNTSVVTNLANVNPAFKQPDDKGVAISSLIGGIAYNYKEYAENHIPAPTDWKSFLNPKLKGHVVITTFDDTLGIAMVVGLAENEGGSATDIGPGFAAAKTVAADSVASTNIDDISSDMETQGAWIGMWTNAEEESFQATGFPVRFVYPKSGGVLIGQTLDVVKGAPHAELAQDLVNYVLSPAIQKAIVTTSGLTPAAKNVTVSAKEKEELGIGHKVVSMDWAVINKNRASWTQRFDEDVLSALG